jgi:flagellar motor switch protein FliN
MSIGPETGELDTAGLEGGAVPLPPAREAAAGSLYDELVAGRVPVAGSDADLSLVHDLPVELAVEIGRTTMTIRETLAIAPGSLIQLNRLAGEPVDLLVNGHRIARGEVVAIDEEFGLRVTEILSPE